MKKLFYKLTGISVILGMTACSGDFLDREPSSGLTPEQITESIDANEQLVAGMINGLYSTTFVPQSGGTTNHDDFGQKSIDIGTDLMTGDMVMDSPSSYGWFEDFVTFSATATNTANRAYMIWRYYYKLIFNANKVIDQFTTDGYTPVDEYYTVLVGRALAMRAYSYFNLVNLYQKPYSENPEARSIPIYTSVKDMASKPRETVSKVYELLVRDLETAKSYLEEEQYDPNNFNKININYQIAEGLLAYVYLTRGDYVKALENAGDVAQKYDIMSREEVVNTGFNNVNIPGWLWGVNLTKDNTGGLATFWGHIDVFTYSYAAAGDLKYMSPQLYASIPRSDIRAVQFRNIGLGVNLPTDKFYDTQGRYALELMSDRTWTNDLVYMRVSEMCLIAAEAAAQLPGKENIARAYLQLLLEERDPAKDISGLSGQALLDEIFWNWRVEFWGEGKALFAYKRFKKDIVRYIGNDIDEIIPYHSDKLVFRIPEQEVINNPNLNN